VKEALAGQFYISCTFYSNCLFYSFFWWCRVCRGYLWMGWKADENL